ncbi:DNA-3-methyladenine glycosylase family protein [Adhaeribacter aquaticus]|uniref:DNA-3-methyladenine glycosylase family protein n=1 Tax=Adhaeribacter aquaticus TaxID=299567 RepID=UPI0003FE9D80|nr:DNA-3-methyladenine glycosylase [Adhaeribacter aquaticus]
MDNQRLESLDWQSILNQDAILAVIIRNGKPIESSSHEDIYLSLLSSIINQQLSTKVARVIKERFLQLFPENYPAPELVLNHPEEVMKGVGLSFQKLNYIKNVAAFAQAGQLSFRLLNTLDDEALIKHLTQIKGVGRWTAEMILMFTLGRPDIFPTDDLGIQNAMKKHYGLTSTGKALVSDMAEIAQHWRPYRTIASRYLWRSLDIF